MRKKPDPSCKTMVGSWVKKILSFQQNGLPAFLLGKSDANEGVRLSIPIGFIGWERLGKERDIQKWKIVTFFFRENWWDFGISNFEWKFWDGEFQTTNCWSSKEWHKSKSFVGRVKDAKWEVKGSPRKHTKTDIKHQPVKGYVWLPNVKHRPDPLCFFWITWMIRWWRTCLCCYVADTLGKLCVFWIDFFLHPRIRMKGSNLASFFENSAESFGPNVGPFRNLFWKEKNHPRNRFPGLLAVKKMSPSFSKQANLQISHAGFSLREMIDFIEDFWTMELRGEKRWRNTQREILWAISCRIFFFPPLPSNQQKNPHRTPKKQLF